MVFILLEVDATLGDEEIWEHLYRSAISPGLFQDFMDEYIKTLKALSISG